MPLLLLLLLCLQARCIQAQVWQMGSLLFMVTILLTKQFIFVSITMHACNGVYSRIKCCLVLGRLYHVLLEERGKAKQRRHHKKTFLRNICPLGSTKWRCSSKLKHRAFLRCGAIHIMCRVPCGRAGNPLRKLQRLGNYGPVDWRPWENTVLLCRMKSDLSQNESGLLKRNS